MLKRQPKERYPERLHPGDREAEYCSPGSIEQQLDMCEEGSLRGDELLHHHGIPKGEFPEGAPEVVELMNQYRGDLAEDDREGAELSGDEHSSGGQGSQELD